MKKPVIDISEPVKAILSVMKVITASIVPQMTSEIVIGLYSIYIEHPLLVSVNLPTIQG